ncbi:GmhA Phosphoheptose isomerase [uncultured Caudovirales phage]|uniref:GmhA Phosphoheptose isomerase n=1 Tax=uncultured Caudovirales phage TaxID=2100421 RepID=A0A6J5M9R4_9CAUD|nr:GmhA Phosphoheptose isomerase [uncultured Caudovirales phage]
MSTEIDNILYQHREAVVKGLYSIKLNRLEQAAKVICKAIKERRDIYTIGNGASASIAQHWACDYTKGSSQLDPENEQFLKVRVHSLASNIPLMTAISNDISYDEVYAYQLERLGAAGDVLVAISSSGNSPNVVRAIEAAIKEKMYVITLTGFDGGEAMKLSNQYLQGVNVHVDCPEYEAAEDCHQAVMHMIAKYIRKTMWK